jgi:fucose permease
MKSIVQNVSSRSGEPFTADIKSQINRAANASLFIFAVSAVALPVCLVNVSQEFGFSLTQAGSLGFISAIEQFAILIFSGFIAARFGKIRVLKTSLLILALGLLLFTQISTYVMAIAIIMIIGTGGAFLEALLTPLVEDLYPDDDGSKQNKLHAFWPIGVLVSTLTAGELLSRGVSWRWIFAGIAMGTIVVYLFYPGNKKTQLPKTKVDFSQFKDIIKQPKFFMMGQALFFAGGAEGAITFWLASYIQLNMGGLPRAGGIGIAVFALGVFLGRLLASQLAKRFKLKQMIQWSTFLGIISSFSFFLVSQILTLYFSVFLSGLMIACLWPSIQTYTVRILPLDPTFIMVLLSCFGIMGFSSATLLMGIIGDASGLRISFMIVPTYLTFLLLIMFLESKVRFKPK